MPSNVPRLPALQSQAPLQLGSIYLLRSFPSERENAKRRYINCRAKALVSWPSSSLQALAPSLRLSHELSLPSILPALYSRGRAGEHEEMQAVPWCWAVQKELSLTLIHAGASPMGQVLGAGPDVPLPPAPSQGSRRAPGLWSLASGAQILLAQRCGCGF